MNAEYPAPAAPSAGRSPGPAATEAQLEASPTLAIFSTLESGDPAPAWLRDAILDHWTPSARPPQITLISVSENATFMVRSAGRPVMVVRIHRPGYVESVEAVASELLWVEALHEEGVVPTASPVRGRDGQLIQQFTSPDGTGWIAVAFGYAPGTVLERAHDLVPHFDEIGRLTALLHEHARTWERPEGFTRFSWEFSDMVGTDARWGDWRDWPLSAEDRDTLERAEAAALTDLAHLQKTPRTWGLVHADLRPSNILIADDGLTVIDFDDSGFTWMLYDFASALTFYEHRPEAPAMARGWLAGYEQIVPLTEEERRAACALSMLRRLTMLGWATTHREDALPPDLWRENAPGTVEVGRRYLADPMWLLRPPSSGAARHDSSQTRQ